MSTIKTNKPNKARGKIGAAPIAANTIQTFLWTILNFSENKSSNNKIAEINVIKGNSNSRTSSDQKL